MKKRNCDAIIQSIITKIACEKKKECKRESFANISKFS